MIAPAVRARLRDLFLDPAAAPVARPAALVAERAAPRALGVLCATEAGAVAGAAIALAAAARAGAPCALVCRWTGLEASSEPGDGLAAPATRRLAGRLAARGLDAVARGRLVTVALPAEGAAARAVAQRAAAAAGETPVVLVVAGPRPQELDAVLAEQDRLIVVPPPGAPAGLEALAIDAAARLGRATGVLRLAGGSGGGRVTAGAGLALSPGLRAAAARALDGPGG